MLVTECRIDLFLENLDTGRLRRNAEGGIIGKRLRIEILGSPDESDVIIGELWVDLLGIISNIIYN